MRIVLAQVIEIINKNEVFIATEWDEGFNVKLENPLQSFELGEWIIYCFENDLHRIYKINEIM